MCLGMIIVIQMFVMIVMITVVRKSVTTVGKVPGLRHIPFSWCPLSADSAVIVCFP